jgi:hypothetical protein
MTAVPNYNCERIAAELMSPSTKPPAQTDHTITNLLRAIRETDLEMRIAKLELSQSESREPSHDGPDSAPNAGGKQALLPRSHG